MFGLGKGVPAGLAIHTTLHLIAFLALCLLLLIRDKFLTFVRSRNTTKTHCYSRAGSVEAEEQGVYHLHLCLDDCQAKWRWKAFYAQGVRAQFLKIAG